MSTAALCGQLGSVVFRRSPALLQTSRLLRCAAKAAASSSPIKASQWLSAFGPVRPGVSNVPFSSAAAAAFAGRRALSGASSASAGTSAHRRDHYEVLGVSRDASPAELKKAYYRLAKEHHPDAGGGSNRGGGDTDRFAEINAAYEVLSDPRRRRLYDDFGHDGVAAADAGVDPHSATHGPGPSPEDILREFGAFFTGHMGGMNMNVNMGSTGMGKAERRAVDDPEPGADKQTTVTLEFVEAAKGVHRTVRVRAARPCRDCNGSGKNRNTSIVSCPDCKGQGHVSSSGGLFGTVIMTCRRCSGVGDILRNPCGSCTGAGTVRGVKETEVAFPAGADDGMVLRVPGAGDDGVRHGPAGDLYIQIRVKEDDYFHRDGKDLHVVAPISISQAALGGHVRVRTLDGEEELTVPPGTQSDDAKILRGRALRSVNSSRRGDQKVHFKVVVPTRLSTKQRELLEELAQLDGGKITRPAECGAPGLVQRFQKFLKNSIGVGSK